MHLVIVTLVKLLRERTVLLRAVSEEGGRAYGDHGDDDEQDDNWHRHASIVYAIAQKRRIRHEKFGVPSRYIQK